MWYDQWQHAVNVLTRQGNYAEAEAKIREAIPHLTQDAQHQAMVDLADTMRTLGSAREALELLDHAVEYFKTRSQGSYADALHHRARLWLRRYCITERALADIALARRLAIGENRAMLRYLQVNPRIVWIRLDYACIQAVLDKPWRARWQATMSVLAAVRFWLLPGSEHRNHVNKRHLGRAWLVFANAKNPNSQDPLVKQAFWGKTP